DPARSAARDENSQPRLRYPRQLAERRAERRPDLHDRPLTTDRTTRPDTQRRCERLDHRHLRTDASAALGNGQHHLRHAVPARLTREEEDQRPVEQPTHDRRGDDEPEPEPVEVAVRRSTGSAVIEVAAERVGEGENQVAKDDGTRPGAAADRKREHHEAARRPAQPLTGAPEPAGPGGEDPGRSQLRALVRRGARALATSAASSSW